MRSLLTCLALFVFSLCACTTRADEVDDFITKFMETQRIPGFSLLVTKDDKVIKRSAYGKASVELDTPMTIEHVFESGSIGKSFTAAVIMKLVEEGKLSLDDPISKYVDKSGDLWKSIKVRNLMNQTSGIPDYALIPGLGLVEQWTTAQWFERMPTQPLDFATGSQFAYSNSNYLLLGLIAEKVGGAPILAQVQEKIFAPLGMTHSYIADEMQIIPKRVSGYYRLPQALLNGPSIRPGYGDGSLINSLEDLATWEKAIREDKVVKPESKKMLQESARLASGRKTGYGAGWFVRDYQGIHIVSHGGNTAGFSASITRIPSENLTIVLMCNVQDIGGDGVAQRIAEFYVPALKAVVLKEATDPNPALTEKLKAGLVGLANANVDQEIIDSEMKSRLATPRGRMGLPGLAQFKEIASFAYLQTEPSDPDRIIRYRAKVGEKKFVVVFTVTKDDRIYSVSARPEV